MLPHIRPNPELHDRLASVNSDLSSSVYWDQSNHKLEDSFLRPGQLKQNCFWVAWKGFSIWKTSGICSGFPESTVGFVALQSIPKKLLSQSHMSLYAWEYNARLFAYKKPPNHRHWTLSGKQKRETGSWSICEWLINFSTTTRDVLSPWLQACSNAPSATQAHRDLILLCAWVSSVK